MERRLEKGVNDWEEATAKNLTYTKTDEIEKLWKTWNIEAPTLEYGTRHSIKLEVIKILNAVFPVEQLIENIKH